MAKLLITGGAGFIGTNFINLMIKRGHKILNLDALTYAGNLKSLQPLESNSNYNFKKVKIQDATAVSEAIKNFMPDVILNFAAESHVDRSILSSKEFIETNITGTQILMDAAREHKISKYIQVSTDEVYGELGETGKFTETTPLDPNSPYSASKAAADMLVLSYVRTHNFPALITRCSNNYGPYQFPEKLIPLMLTNALEDKSLPVYGKGTNIRDWIHVEDHCLGIEATMEMGRVGEVYNFGGNAEKQNIEIVKTILNALGKPKSLITHVTDRPGHDFRYAIDATKAKTELNWAPQTSFEDGIKSTIDWYLKNQTWWQEIKSGEYQTYYQTQYGN